MGKSPKRWSFQFPGISLADVYAALTYYFDNRDEIEPDFRKDEETEKWVKADIPSRFAPSCGRKSVAEPIRYFFDQHVLAGIVSGLRQHGVDVLTAHEANRCGLPDPDQLAFATADERVLITFDPDFLALHEAGVARRGHRLVSFNEA